MGNQIIPFPGCSGASTPRAPESPSVVAFCLRNAAARLENIQASLIITQRNLAKVERVYLESAAVQLCESSLGEQIAEVITLANALAPDHGTEVASA